MNNAAPAQAPLPAVIDPVLAAFQCQSQPTATQLQVPVAWECVQMPRQAEWMLAQLMGCNHIRKQEEAQAAADEEKSMKIRQRDL